MPASAGGGQTAGGPAAAALSTVAVTTVTVVRCIGSAYIAASVLIWHGFYLAAAWRLAGPAAAVASAMGVVAGLRHGLPPRRLALADAVVHLTLALTVVWFVPPLVRSDTTSWLYIALLDQLVLPALFGSVRLIAALAAASAAAYWGGDLLSGHPGGSPLAAAAFLLAVPTALGWGVRALGRRAAAADLALAQADQEARDQYIRRSRSAERREHERLLHDTVLNTLTALARQPAGRPADAVRRCQHDVTLMEQMLSEAAGTGGQDGVAGAGTGPDLLAGIEAAAREMRGRGLAVQVSAGGQSGPGEAGLAVPGPVAAAMAHAVREALANVLAHAGTAQAWVDASPLAGGVQVVVRDNGAGFDTGSIGPARLGVRRSIVERLADAGGEASVRSAPGAGTEIRLRWPRAQEESGSAAG